MKLRVLCLHDESSSALSLIRLLQKLGKQLHHDHNIELAFVNSPHIDVNPDMTSPLSSSHDDDEKEMEDGENFQMERGRVWFYKSSGGDNDEGIRPKGERRVGLDASILHLRQTWSRSLYSNPFHGVLGIGQGASIAALLPFLRFDDPLRSSEDDILGCEDVDTDVSEEGASMMFPGLQFSIFINGRDLLSSKYNDDDSDPDHVEYKDATELPSLHIYNQEKIMSHELYHRYGGNDGSSRAKNLVLKSSIQNRDKENQCDARIVNTHGSESEYSTKDNMRLNAKAMNAIGKFLVQQKKNTLSHLGQHHSRKSSESNQTEIDCGHAGNYSPTFDFRPPCNNHNESPDDTHGETAKIKKGKEIASVIESTQQQLAQAEKRALELIHECVSENPPKALMAMILPNTNGGNGGQKGGTIVGGWMGDRDAFRDEDFVRERGAPCPAEFTLPAEDREKMSKNPEKR